MYEADGAGTGQISAEYFNEAKVSYDMAVSSYFVHGNADANHWLFVVQAIYQ